MHNDDRAEKETNFLDESLFFSWEAEGAGSAFDFFFLCLDQNIQLCEQIAWKILRLQVKA